MALPPEVLQQILQQMGGQLGGNQLYQQLSQVGPAQGQGNAQWTPYDDVLAQMSQDPLLGQDPMAYYQSIGGENVRGYNQPDDIMKIQGERSGLLQDIAGLQADQYKWQADEEQRALDRRKSQYELGDPTIDARTFAELQQRNLGVGVQDVAASFDPADPDYAENINALFGSLQPIDPVSGQAATPDSSYGRVWLAEVRNALGQVAQEDMADIAAEQASSMENQAFRKAYMGATGDQGWTNTTEGDWFYGKGADKRAAAWEGRKQLTGDELAASRATAGAARETARGEYLDRAKTRTPGVDPALARSIAPPSAVSRSIMPVAGAATARFERERAAQVGRPQAAEEVARAVLQAQPAETMFGGSMLPPAEVPVEATLPRTERTTSTAGGRGGFGAERSPAPPRGQVTDDRAILRAQLTGTPSFSAPKKKKPPPRSNTRRS
jgi:hypothetical protein